MYFYICVFAPGVEEIGLAVCSLLNLFTSCIYQHLLHIFYYLVPLRVGRIFSYSKIPYEEFYRKFSIRRFLQKYSRYKYTLSLLRGTRRCMLRRIKDLLLKENFHYLLYLAYLPTYISVITLQQSSLHFIWSEKKVKPISVLTQQVLVRKDNLTWND